MEMVLNDYLEKVEKYLKPMAASERIDIVKEIKSEILELQHDGKTPGEIVDRLGSPKELAKAYLGESIGKSTAFSWKKFGSVVAFYGLAGTAWLFVLPLTSTLGIGFMAAGILSPIAGAVKFIGFLFGVDIVQIGFIFGAYSATVTTVLPISIILGAAFFFAGKLLWNLTVRLVRKISKAKASMPG